MVLGQEKIMPYEDPIEAALRALTGVEWTKRKHGFETRINKTHLTGIEADLGDHQIDSHSEVSAARSGRYILTIVNEETPKILKAVEKTGVEVKPHRRKWHS